MTAPPFDGGLAGLLLPPAFSGRVAAPPQDAFTQACAIAVSARADEAAGTLVVVERADVLDLAVVLAPAEPLAPARRAFHAGMTALTDAVGAHAPPEMPLSFDWPDTLRFDGARLGGGRLGWPDGCGEDEVPDWLVFSAMLIVSKAHAGDPGLTPGSTALNEQGFEPGSPAALVESFARNLVRAFAIWEEDGFEGIAQRYLAHLPQARGVPARIDPNGDALLEGAAGPERLALLPALREPAWLDRETGTVRL